MADTLLRLHVPPPLRRVWIRTWTTSWRRWPRRCLRILALKLEGRAPWGKRELDQNVKHHRCTPGGDHTRATQPLVVA